jgi:hypothetical protein
LTKKRPKSVYQSYLEVLLYSRFVEFSETGVGAFPFPVIFSMHLNCRLVELVKPKLVRKKIG